MINQYIAIHVSSIPQMEETKELLCVCDTYNIASYVRLLIIVIVK